MKQGTLLLALAVLAGPLEAQKLRVGVHAVGLTHSEVSETLNSQGGGGAASLAARLGRWSFEGWVGRARMTPDSADLSSFDMVFWSARVGFWLAPIFAVEVGGGARGIDPEFSAQDVGGPRIGFVSEYPLANISNIRVRGAYLVNPQFNGGGEADLAVEIALGVTIGTANGRFRVRGEGGFQRIDRKVNGVEVPIQMTSASLGVEFGFF